MQDGAGARVTLRTARSVVLNSFQGPRRSVALQTTPQDRRHLTPWTLKQVQGDDEGTSRGSIIKAVAIAARGSMRHPEPMRDRSPCVYILANQTRGTLYIGVTSDLPARLWQHRNGTTKGFVWRYRIFRLVHAEAFDDMHTAITREKQLKRWHRAWKIGLIEQANPEWRDLAIEWKIAEPLSNANKGLLSSSSSP